MRSGYRGAEWVYYCDDGRGRIKIGYSLNPWQRVAEFRTINPELEMVVTESGDRELERLRHRQFHEEHIAGEWFLRSERLNEWLEFLSSISEIETHIESVGSHTQEPVRPRYECPVCVEFREKKAEAMAKWRAGIKRE